MMTLNHPCPTFPVWPNLGDQLSVSRKGVWFLLCVRVRVTQVRSHLMTHKNSTPLVLFTPDSASESGLGWCKTEPSGASFTGYNVFCLLQLKAWSKLTNFLVFALPLSLSPSLSLYGANLMNSGCLIRAISAHVHIITINDVTVWVFPFFHPSPTKRKFSIY